MAHHSQVGPSLTAVGWQGTQAADGLRIPGGIQASHDDYEAGSIEPLWQAAYPPDTLRRRIGYGLYGVSSQGYWAIVCPTHRQIEALLAHGSNARATSVVTWPALAVGLTADDVARRWPVLGLVKRSASVRYLADPPLYTPSALVHRLFALGVAPITPMTANLALISQQSMVFDGIPWFAFRYDRQAEAMLVVEVTTAGVARRLGRYPALHDAIIERCWGVRTSTVESGWQEGVIPPSSLEQLPVRGAILRDQLTRLGPALDGGRVCAADIESLLNGDASDIVLGRVPPAGCQILASASEACDGQVLGRVDPGSQLLLKPPNGPAPRRPRLGGGRRLDAQPVLPAAAREAV